MHTHITVPLYTFKPCAHTPLSHFTLSSHEHTHDCHILLSHTLHTHITILFCTFKVCIHTLLFFFTLSSLAHTHNCFSVTLSRLAHTYNSPILHFQAMCTHITVPCTLSSLEHTHPYPIYSFKSCAYTWLSHFQTFKPSTHITIPFHTLKLCTHTLLYKFTLSSLAQAFPYCCKCIFSPSHSFFFSNYAELNIFFLFLCCLNFN